jgi:WD40 repeat protein
LIASTIQEEKAKLAGQQEMLSKLEAENNAELAERNLRIAQRLYYLTKAQELASKAAVQDDDHQLAGLQAMQGYNFHTKYEGRKYDRYIYEGLYSATAKLFGSSYNAIKIQGPPRIHMRSLALSSDNNTFYVSGADGRIYKASRETLVSERTGFETAYPSKVIALSKDEKYLVNGSDSTLLHLYDLKNGVKPKIISGLSGATNDIEFFPDDSGFIVASQDKSLRFYDIKKGELRTLVTLPYEIKSISIRHDAKMLAAASWSGQILLINLEDNSITELASEPNMRMLSIKFSGTGKYLAYGMEEGSRRGLVRLYDFETKATRQFTGHRAGVYDLEFSFDEKLLASAGSDKRLQLYVLESLEDLPVVMENNNGFIWDIEFTRDSDYLIAACSESEIRVWPTDPALLAKKICPKLTRNMSEDEWLKYVGSDTEYETTCNVQSAK